MKKKIVALTGAGISAESGIKTFRDSDGLWNEKKVEDVATPEAWERNPQFVLDFYNQRRREVQLCNPNKAHYSLAELEKIYDVTLLTQNVDDLHERAGSKNVVHLHGEIMRGRFNKDLNLISHSTRIYGDIEIEDCMRPDVVWFGEEVMHLEYAEKCTREADYFIVVGTSLEVFPVAGLIFLLKPNTPIILADPGESPGILKNPLFSVRHFKKPATISLPLIVALIRGGMLDEKRLDKISGMQ